MNRSLIVCPNKNEFLLYALLNVFDLIKGDYDSHPLKRITTTHFKEYQGNKHVVEKLPHHSKAAFFVLAHNEAPDYTLRPDFDLDSLGDEEKNEFHLGSGYAPHLIHFYENTDFERFYREILPGYTEICNVLREDLERANLKKIVDDSWELKNPLDIHVIPMPILRHGEGIGPSINNTSYPIVGITSKFPHDYSFLVAHEASHPNAKKILGPMSNAIAKKEHLFDVIKGNPNFPREYSNWATCFEEHFIRAMQAGYINPFLGINFPVEKRLALEEGTKGMIFIRDFYEELKRHKDNPTNSLQEVALRILERLDKKYQNSSKS